MVILMKVFLKKDSGLKPVQMCSINPSINAGVNGYQLIKDFSPQRFYIRKIMFNVMQFLYLRELKKTYSICYE
jgi:hypothetical protein